MISTVHGIYNELIYGYKEDYCKEFGLRPSMKSDSCKINSIIEDDLSNHGFSSDEIKGILNRTPDEKVRYKFIAYRIGSVVPFKDISELNRIVKDFNFHLSDVDLDIILSTSKDVVL